MDREPNFFIVGAQKSGSTWLARELSQHPDIYVAPHEIHYFDKAENLDKGIDWYLSHFRDAGACRAVGEKTPDYLWAGGDGAEGHNPNVHRDLTAAYPDAKYLVILRDPVRRAMSALVHIVKTNRLPLEWPLDRYFNEDYAERLRPWGIVEKGEYGRQLEEYLKLIPEEQLRVYFFESDLLKHPEVTMREICGFLGVDPAFKFENLGQKKNKSPETRKSLLRTRLRAEGREGWLDRLRLRFTEETPLGISDATVQRLRDHYREDRRRLEAVVGREITEWKWS